MTRPFDIKEVKQNDVLPTKSGAYTVEIICTNADGVFPIAGLATGLEYKNKLFSFKADGTWMFNDDDDSMDLILPDYKESIDVYVYRDLSTGKLTSSNDEQLGIHSWFKLVKKVTIQI